MQEATVKYSYAGRLLVFCVSCLARVDALMGASVTMGTMSALARLFSAFSFWAQYNISDELLHIEIRAINLHID